MRRPKLVRFSELDWDSINVELQAHTTWTDGRCGIREILQQAQSKGLAAIAFTEHVRRESDWFADFAREVRAHAADFRGLRVYVGCEAKVLDFQGTLDASEQILADSELVLGSVHRFPDGNGSFQAWETMGAQEMADTECALALALLRRAPIDVLAHPGGMTLRRHGRFPKSHFRRILAASLLRSIAVEINSSYLRDLPGFLQLCREINPFVSIGSDVHDASQTAHCRDQLRLWKSH